MVNSAGKRTAMLYVQVTVRQPDRSLAVGIPLRVIVGTPPGWQLADAGTRCVTGDDGSCNLESPLVLEDRRRKLPSNFLSTLLASRERTRHLQVGLELEYAGRPWLTVIDADRFGNGTTAQLDPMRVYGRATDGRFTDDVPRNDGAWRKRLPSGQVMSLPGFDVTSVQLDPDPDVPNDALWRLLVGLTRWADPVLRDESTIQYGSRHNKGSR